jgi:site-specific recombinase XerD
VIPVERLETIELLNNPERIKRMRKLSYSGHLKRWQLAVERLRITSLKPTPHAVRHYYATRAYERSGRNLRVVQELLGHSDINTTARYLGVDLEELRNAVGAP